MSSIKRKWPIDEFLAKSDPVQTIAEHTDAALKCAGALKEIYGIDDKLFIPLTAAIEYHDYGKMNEEFEHRIEHGGRFNPENEIPHNLLSASFIPKDEFKDKADYYAVVYAVMNHHSGKLSINDILRKHWTEYKKTVEEMGCKVVPQIVVKRANEAAKEDSTIIIKGLLHRCDYASSAGIEVDYKNDFLESGMSSLMNKWKEEGQRITPPVERDWNKLQVYCRDRQDENIMVTAPTGMGKTEAALLWIGNNKGIYVLPLRTAINSIFNRIADNVLNHDQIEKRLALLHSDTVGYMIRSNYENEYAELDLLSYRVRASQFALPLTVTTPDQLFTFVFKGPAYEMKLATAAYSKIIIDEIQAYDATLLAYVIHGIQQIIKLGGKVAILTATLPGFVSDYIKNGEEYLFASENFLTDSARHNVQVIKEELDTDAIVKKFHENKEQEKSNKILVLCNTVKKAQEIYQRLSDELSDEVRVRLIHAKFTKEDRSRLEREIQEDGQTYNENGEIHCKEIIWVATSVVEASLDIDFDYLFTELSDLNSLFQRFGRVNRKGMKNIDETNCYVYTEIDENLLNRGGEQGFIDETMYNLSIEALESVDGVITEKEKVTLIEEYFSTERMENSKFDTKYKAEKSYLETLNPRASTELEVRKSFRNIISYPVIPKKIYDEREQEIIDAKEILDAKIPKDMQEDEKHVLWKKKQKARADILNLTVDVGYFDLHCKPNPIYTKIELSQYEVIYVIYCEYDERGFIRRQKDTSDFGIFT